MTQPPSFAEAMDRMLREAYERLDDKGCGLVDMSPLFESDAVTREGGVYKVSMSLPVSCCLMTDTTGENHCDHPPRVYPRPPWHKRARWWLSARWSSLRLRLGSWIAGTDLNERDDW